MAKVESGKDSEVLNEVIKTPGVKHAIPTYGEYDLHVDAEFKTKDELDKFILDKIRKTPGITRTLTLVAFRRYERK